MSATASNIPAATDTIAVTTNRRNSRPRIRRTVNRRTPASWVVLIVMIVGAVATVIPFFFAALNAFKTTPDYVSRGPLAIPNELSFAGLANFWNYVNFGNKLLNSVLISGGVAIIGVIISLLAAYALGIGRVRGRFLILSVVLVAFTMPQEALIYPIYYGFKAVGLYDTQVGVIIILSVISAAFGTYMLSSVMSQFPVEILEAAKIDGAGMFRILWSVVIPIVRPTMAVLATFFFIWTWNDFFVSLIMLPTANHETVSVSLGLLFGQFTTDPVLAAAASLAGILPTFVFFILFQRTLMRGVTLGAVK